VERRIRVLLAKPTQDCHDRGVRYLMRMLRDNGFEVIFTNFLVAEEILSSALQEDVDVIGISSSSGGHMPVFEDLLAGMRKQGLDDVLLVGGGIIPPRDIRALKEWGVAEVFRPGSSAEDLIEFILKNVRGAGVDAVTADKSEMSS